MANFRNGTIYTGVTNNLVRRVWQHKSKQIEGFTKKYNLTKLVYYESTSSIVTAIEREKFIKNRGRKWKLALIEEKNPTWEDLVPEINPLDPE